MTNKADSKPPHQDNAKKPAPSHPGMMGDGTEEQNLGQPGNPAARIKEDDHLKTIPTVILTTSDAEADILTSYQLQANCYLSKPVQLEEFENLVRSINDFWLTRVKLPQHAQGD